MEGRPPLAPHAFASGTRGEAAPPDGSRPAKGWACITTCLGRVVGVAGHASQLCRRWAILGLLLRSAYDSQEAVLILSIRVMPLSAYEVSGRMTEVRKEFVT